MKDHVEQNQVDPAEDPDTWKNSAKESTAKIIVKKKKKVGRGAENTK